MRVWVLLVLVTACGRIGFDPAGAASSFRKTLTIDHTQVAGDLADFPVLIELHDAEVAAHAAPDGHDLRFTDASGSPLSYEREHYATDPSALIAWVKVPALSHTSDTILVLEYGDASVADQAQPAAVWTNAFTGVFHFGDGTTLDIVNATAGKNGINFGATASTGKIYGAMHVDNAGNSANRVGTASGALDIAPGALNTVTYWVNYTGAPGKGMFAFTDPTGAVYDLWFQADGCVGFNTEGGGVLGTTTSGLRNAWHHIAAVFYNGVPTAGSNKLYVDGVPQTLVTTCDGPPPNTRTVGGTADWGGNTEGGSTNYEMTGDLDEGRLAIGERSPEWIATEFANQSAPTTFVRVGPEQP